MTAVGGEGNCQTGNLHCAGIGATCLWVRQSGCLSPGRALRLWLGWRPRKASLARDAGLVFW